MADSAMVSAIFVHKKIENFHPRFLSETFFTVPFLYIRKDLNLKKAGSVKKTVDNRF